MKKLLLIVLILFACEDPASPKDCAGVENGTASIDDCGLCTGGTTNLDANYTKDECGVCFGNSTSCSDVCGVINGVTIQECGSCDFVYLWGECYNIESTENLRLYNSLIGEIPPEIGKLINLAELVLAGSISGEIPPEIGELTNLTKLRLNGSSYPLGESLSGEIPPEIGKLINLTELDLSENNLTGEIPIGIGILNELTELDLGANDLTGSVPSEIGSLINLTLLDLSNNQLTGAIPSEIGNLTNLTLLPLNANGLTSIPEALCDISVNLLYLWQYFANNSFCGELPSCLTADDIGTQNCP